MKKLTAKEQRQRRLRFCEEYIKDLHGEHAAIRAGYSEKSARYQASKMLARDDVQAHIAELQQARSDRCGVQADDVIRQLVRMGFADVRKLFTPEGQLRPVHELDDDTAAAIQSIEVVTKFIPGPGDEPPEVEYLHKIKMIDKIKPLELIGKHMGKQLGQWSERLEHTGKDGGPIQSVSADLSPEEASKLYREMLAGR